MTKPEESEGRPLSATDKVLYSVGGLLVAVGCMAWFVKDDDLTAKMGLFLLAFAMLGLGAFAVGLGQLTRGIKNRLTRAQQPDPREGLLHEQVTGSVRPPEWRLSS